MRSGKTSPKIEDARKNRGQTPAKARLSDVRQRRLSRLCSRTGNPTCAPIGADTVMTVAADSHRASPAFGGLTPRGLAAFCFFLLYENRARMSSDRVRGVVREMRADLSQSREARVFGKKGNVRAAPSRYARAAFTPRSNRRALSVSPSEARLRSACPRCVCRAVRTPFVRGG